MCFYLSVLAHARRLGMTKTPPDDGGLGLDGTRGLRYLVATARVSAGDG